MQLDQTLVDAAIAQMDRRWPADEPGGAAAVYLEDGKILTSVGLDNLNGGVSLCHETGAICQAYTLNKKVTASVCVYRASDRDRVLVLQVSALRVASMAPYKRGVADSNPTPPAR
ncbi:hypothetical protein AB0J37_17965 [Microbispora rosea]|uniref:hypothetical protein n=1 Tax=Microbispora rosea TaxID=58117 RepID=UPI00342AE7DE